ncbi:MAG TPA: hypothetical protein VGM68_10730 [Rhizomicrobium sp.]|jgi:hypothetical protein
MRLGLAAVRGAVLGLMLAAPVWAASAGKPVIEIRALVSCAAHPDAMLLPVPTEAGDCVSRQAIVQGGDFVGLGHLRDSGKDFLILTMSEPARRRFYGVLKPQSEKPVALMIDGWVVATPLLWDRIEPASLQIAGINPFQIDKLVTRFRSS